MVEYLFLMNYHHVGKFLVYVDQVWLFSSVFAFVLVVAVAFAAAMVESTPVVHSSQQ